MTTQILNFSFNDAVVFFRKDGFLNATEIAKHFSKRPNDYLVNARTTEYINALIEILSVTGNPVTQSDLIIIKKGSSKQFTQGTWLHPKLAVDFARWLNPKFAVWCDEQIEKIIAGQYQSTLKPPLMNARDYAKPFPLWSVNSGLITLRHTA